MSQTRFPAVFVSHGSPMIVLEDSPARTFLESFGRTLGRPQAILVCTAHFETDSPRLTADEHPGMIYDFRGFPPELSQVDYPAPGDPALATRAAVLLDAAGFPARTISGRGYDHGTWTPLKLMYPDADIPVVQISIQPDAGAAHHIALGRALSGLREEGVLLMGSGSMTHNLPAFSQVRRLRDFPTPAWVSQFGEWVREKVEAGSVQHIAEYLELAPFASENHPTDDHFLPLPFAMGAGGEGAKGTRVHTGHNSGVLLMDAYTFE